MYSLLGRINYIIYNAMLALMCTGAINHIMVRFGHHIGVREQPIGLDADKIDFNILEVS